MNFTVCIILHTQTLYLRISTLINCNTLNAYDYTTAHNIIASTIIILSIFDTFFLQKDIDKLFKF